MISSVTTLDEIIKTIQEEHQKLCLTTERPHDGEGGEKPWDLYGILADIFEEQGELEKAQRVRWLKDHKKRPYIEHGEEEIAWFNGEKYYEKDERDKYSNLPEEDYKRLKKGKEIANHRKYESFKEAIMDFIES